MKAENKRAKNWEAFRLIQAVLKASNEKFVQVIRAIKIVTKFIFYS